MIESESESSPQSSRWLEWDWGRHLQRPLSHSHQFLTIAHHLGILLKHFHMIGPEAHIVMLVTQDHFYSIFFVNDIFTAIKLFQSAIIRWIKICISLLLGFWFMFFFFLDGRYVCDILESHCSFTIFTQFNWFIGKKEYVQKKQVTRIEKKNIYNRQTSRDNTYHERWHI